MYSYSLVAWVVLQFGVSNLFYTMSKYSIINVSNHTRDLNTSLLTNLVYWPKHWSIVLVNYVLYLVSMCSNEVCVKCTYNHPHLQPLSWNYRRLQNMIAHRSSMLTQAMINLIGGLCTLTSIAMKFALRVT